MSIAPATGLRQLPTRDTDRRTGSFGVKQPLALRSVPVRWRILLIFPEDFADRAEREANKGNADRKNDE